MPARWSPRRAWPLAAIALLAVACSSSAKTTTASAGPTATSAPATTTPAPDAPVKTASSSLGTIVVDTAGMTLYHFDKDRPGAIACNAGCMTAWPPLTVTTTPSGSIGGGALGAATRPDGRQQLTWNGLPLYHFAADKAPGDAKGDGLGGLWHAAVASTAGAPAPATTAKAYGY